MGFEIGKCNIKCELCAKAKSRNNLLLAYIRFCILMLDLPQINI